MTHSQIKPSEKHLAMRVVKGGLVPADESTRRALNRTGLKIGHLVLMDLERPRRPAFYRLAHKLGGLCKENIEQYAHLSEHQVLKQLQAETGLGCEPLSVSATEYWDQISVELSQSLGDQVQPALNQMRELLADKKVITYKPRSLAFGAMAEDEFASMFLGFCRYIAETYWPELDEKQIAQMVRLMPED